MAPLAIAPNLPPQEQGRDKTGTDSTAAVPGFQGELARQLRVRAPGENSPTVRERTADSRNEMAPARTPLTGSQAASALSTAWRTVTGQPPNPKLLSVLVAQWAHETGRGEAMLNYNFGGIKGSAPSGLSAVYRTHEGSGETARITSDRFRAYRSAGEGAADYVRFLRARFPAALGAAQAGDASGFVHELKRSGYFTDNEESYARSVSDLARRAERDGFDSIGAGTTAKGVSPTGLASFAHAASGLPIANPLIDSGALADEIAQAALRIAQSTPEDYLNDIERLHPRTAT